MRTITKGVKPNQEKKVKCGNCKSTIGYLPEDTKQDRDGRFIECPECGKILGV